MNEFNAQTGGRYTYVDDILNLQELALAFSSLFSECDNFIVSGCNVSGTQISSGYVYIKGKLRYFPGKTGISQWPQFIYESNKNESVSYASGGSKLGRTKYECAIGNSVPTAPDPITGQTPSFIKVSSTEAPRLRDAFFGKYAITKNTTLSQTISSPITFQENASFNKGIGVKGKLNMATGNSKAEIAVENNNLVIRNQVSNGVIREITISSNSIVFYSNKTPVCTITDEKITFGKPVIAESSQFGSIKIKNGEIYEHSSQNDNGSLYINRTGYNEGTAYFRNTYIGDGKQNNIIEIIGKDKRVNCKALLNIESNNNFPIIIKSLFSKTSQEYRPAIKWIDNSNSDTAIIGFGDSQGVFNILNQIGDIKISGKQAVNIGPVIQENGVPLSEKYVLKNGDGDNQKDTGWVNITQGLYARQIGNTVSIQGTIRTMHSGLLFTIPNNIDPPKYDVVFCSGDYHVWRTRIKGGQKTCNVEYCNNFCGSVEGFSLTYMI